MKAKVTQIEGQKIEKDREVTGYEAEQLLKKYGYSDNQDTIQDNSTKTNPLTFEEMVKQKDREEKNRLDKERQRRYGPKPITFDSDKGYHSETRYGSDEASGFGFKVEITSDMKIPK